MDKYIKDQTLAQACAEIEAQHQGGITDIVSNCKDEALDFKAEDAYERGERLERGRAIEVRRALGLE